MSSTVHFGIAGWSYPDWKGVVYPAHCKDSLRHCARYVDCIEINTTFYRPPDAGRCASWAERTSDLPAFFTAKLPQVFTHDLDLDPDLIQQTRAGFAPLLAAGKLAMLLAQFSYRFTAAPEHRHHLARLCDAFADLAPIAVEVRHRSWAAAEALAFARDLDVSLVHLDYPGWQSGFGPWQTDVLGPGQIAYFRLHGRNAATWFAKDAGRDEVYDYLYRPDEVDQLARRVADLAAAARRTIVIGNNHFHGQALKVVLELMSAWRQDKVPVPPELVRAFPDLDKIAVPERGLFS